MPAYGYKYAGLEDGHKCWFGETAPCASRKVEEAKSSKQCTGSGQTCGGAYLIEIYSTGVKTPLPPAPPPPASWSVVGSLVDPVTPRALPNKPEGIVGRLPWPIALLPVRVLRMLGGGNGKLNVYSHVPGPSSSSSSMIATTLKTSTSRSAASLTTTSKPPAATLTTVSMVGSTHPQVLALLLTRNTSSTFANGQTG